MKTAEEIITGYSCGRNQEGEGDLYLEIEMHDAVKAMQAYADQETEKLREALTECRAYFGENDVTVSEHKMFAICHKALENK